ncbi:YbaB/EbfC family DNA-binding protein [Microbacterium protaetiae]|uniref:YbaB/EbfC family DNA-binding protein n=1 Tax=Microbacterium protaetiae TaxID=2509458 RepID=A0A4P6EDS7_9MICO|nr:YbaB/EbfC family nucleoid-associated protein [Microbacterium protaetiae]QAY59229.1 YbaB/EbfC family DNA-binding protein [Microbacterium protaetiae]
MSMESAADILMAIGAQLQRAQEVSVVAERLSDELARLRGVGETDEGEVSVTVDHNGLILDVALNDDALAQGGPHAAALVMQAMHRAIEDVQRKGQPLRDAILQPHLTPPLRTDLGDKLDELYDRIDRIDRRTQDDSQEER